MDLFGGNKKDPEYWRKKVAGKSELRQISSGLGPTEARALADVLKLNTTLTTLYLPYNSIGAEGARAMAEALKAKSALTTLDLRNNSIGAEGARAIAEALKVNSALTTLCLYKNSIGAEGARAIAEALKVNSTLTTLDLESNSIGAEGARAMAEAFKVNSTLTTVDLAINSIGTEGARAIAEALKVNSTLTKLRLVDTLYIYSNEIPEDMKRNIEILLADPNRALKKRNELAAAERERERQRIERENAAHLAAREQEEIEARRAQLALELRMKELEIREREAALAAAAAAARNPPPKPLVRAVSDATVTPSSPGSNGTNSTASNFSNLEFANNGYLSKLRITPDQVTYSESDKLGAGSFGVVYKGRLRGATAVAVKTIKGEMNARMVKMFLQEISVWDGLNQRNVLPLLAFCQDPPMMVSELVSHGNMQERLEALDWNQKVGIRYLHGVATGMAYLHSFNVLHGDLKCENVMIDHDIPKIADFGLSRTRTHLTTASTVDGAQQLGGSPVFMAPERWRGGKLRPAVDVYAFAMMCYEVTDEGTIPFLGLNMAMLIGAVTSGQRPERPDSVEDGMWELMQKMWAQEPSVRPTFVQISETMETW